MGEPPIRVTWFDGIDIPMIEMWIPVAPVEGDCEPFYGYMRFNNPGGMTDPEWYEALRTARSVMYQPGRYEENQ